MIFVTLGSYNQQCDSKTGQCNCRPGVTGKKCNQCAMGFWGIKQIINSNSIGCLRMYLIVDHVYKS
jgi:hypothetical protein